MMHITKIEIAIVDRTDPKKPLWYTRATYSFFPGFKVGDKFSLSKESDEDYAVYPMLVNRNPTHVITDIHWIQPDVTEDEPVPYMVVTIEALKPKRTARITFRDGN